MRMTLKPELAELISRKIGQNGFRDAEDVVRQAVELLDLSDRDPVLREARLRLEVQKGVADFEAGRFTVIHDEEELRAFFANL